ncbi:nitroreductase family protein [Alkaliphilus crotonatoxidans]
MLELLTKRRSIRAYEEAKLTEEQVKQLIKAALLSPTSKNSQSWDFIVVDDAALLEKLSQAKPQGAGFLKNAALGIVVVADSNVSDVWIEDASIAATILHLTAESMGLGSCWVQIRQRQHGEGKTAGTFLQEQLGIPSHKQALAIIAVGHKGEQKNPHSEEELKFDRVHINHYGNPLKP